MKKIGDIINVVSGILLVALGLWFVISCMQVANQTVQPWNLIELLF